MITMTRFLQCVFDPQPEENHLASRYDAFIEEAQRLKGIIDRHMQAARDGKTIKTIENNVEKAKAAAIQLIKITPPGHKNSVFAKIIIFTVINFRHITTLEEIVFFDEAKKELFQAFYEGKITDEMPRPGIGKHPELKILQYKKALRWTLKALDFFPNNECFNEYKSDITECIDELKPIAGAIKKVKK